MKLIEVLFADAIEGAFNAAPKFEGRRGAKRN